MDNVSDMTNFHSRLFVHAGKAFASRSMRLPITDLPSDLPSVSPFECVVIHSPICFRIYLALLFSSVSVSSVCVIHKGTFAHVCGDQRWILSLSLPTVLGETLSLKPTIKPSGITNGLRILTHPHPASALGLQCLPSFYLAAEDPNSVRSLRFHSRCFTGSYLLSLKPPSPRHLPSHVIPEQNSGSRAG